MARKSKEFRELLQQDSILPPKGERLSSERQKQLAAFAEFKNKIKSDPNNQDKIFVKPAKNQRKMSEVLLQFAGPLMEDAEDLEESQSLFGIAVMGWNLALLPEADRETFLQRNPFLDNLLDPEEVEAAQCMLEILQMMIERKLELFADDLRMVGDYQLVDTGNDYHLSVSYSVPLDS